MQKSLAERWARYWDVVDEALNVGPRTPREKTVALRLEREELRRSFSEAQKATIDAAVQSGSAGFEAVAGEDGEVVLRRIWPPLPEE
ncbi:MAG: hypothetical protein GY871_04570 [Actinomycetales bacterium]|nr:hypothetical protein [Actinomycetales bacterium]